VPNQRNVIIFVCDKKLTAQAKTHKCVSINLHI